MPAKLTPQQFEERANKIHNFRYQYFGDYIGGKIKIKILCNVHGFFKQRPDDHFNKKNGCPKCYAENRVTNTEEFKIICSKKHDNFFDYKKSIYTSNKGFIIIGCPIHGDFKQRAGNHIQGQGCPKCSKNIKLNHDQFILISQNQHNNKYEYPDEYSNNRKSLNIVCPLHGVFKQKPLHHMRGHGCPKCAKKIIVKTSKGQRELFDKLKSIFKNIELEKILDFNKNNYIQADICFSKEKIVIEYHGDYWHCNPKKYKPDYFHKKKNKTAQELWNCDEKRQKRLEDLGYKVFVIWENDFKNNKENIVNELLKQIEQCQKN